jgi:hypothetical protein
MKGFLSASALATIGVLAFAVFSPAQEPAAASHVRLGVYDSRAIAVAYAPSQFNPVRERMAEHERAKAARDAKRVRELEAWGNRHQRALHRQAFARVPVDDLLAHVEEHLPELARAAGVRTIVPYCTYQGPDVELVDVTRELVMLFEPSEKTLATVAELLRKAPLDLDEVERSKDH